MREKLSFFYENFFFNGVSLFFSVADMGHRKATFDNSKELVVTLKYCFEKQRRLSRNHVKIMLAF